MIIDAMVMNKHRRVRNLIREHNWVPVEISLNDRLYWDIVKWCERTFEDGTWAGSLKGAQGENTKFAFLNDSDAMLFKLRWMQ